MKVAVVGSRSFNNRDLLFSTLDEVKGITLVVSGGAVGADRIAEEYAKFRELAVVVFLPDYQKYGRSAPIKRNRLIVENADMVIAFWDGKSRGTKNALDEAKRLGKSILTVEFSV